jgi:hypothetical protein
MRAWAEASDRFGDRMAVLAIAVQRAMSRLRHQRVNIDGQIWPYLVGGPANARHTFLMVHGFASNKDIPAAHRHARAVRQRRHCLAAPK